MFRVLRFTAKATLADVARAICRTPARRIALVFPLGDRTRFADTGRMDAVASLCREHHKDATIVGGDELLRASAVAGGLRAAVTLDDWRDVQSAWTLRRPKSHGDLQPRLEVIARTERGEDAQGDGETGDEGDGWDDPFAVDPPTYVRELLALYRQADEGNVGEDVNGQPEVDPAHQPIRLRRPFAVAPRTSSLAYDLDSGDRLRALSEDDEERMTATIRRTSGLDAGLFATSWPASLDAAAPSRPKG